MSESKPNYHFTNPRKKMRKGTQSCAECRRRKIRCNYTAGSSVCSSCVARGSLCVGQQVEALATDERISLRDRVTKLERLLVAQERVANGGLRLAGTGPDSGSSTAHEDEDSSGDIEILGGSQGVHNTPPFVELMGDAEITWSGSQGSDARSKERIARCSNEQYVEIPSPSLSRLGSPSRKSAAICSTLRACLPSYNILIACLSLNHAWWYSFRTKSDPPHTKIESLTALAMRTYTSNSPSSLALLVAAYARSSSKNYRLYTLVDSLIISDLKYAVQVERTTDAMKGISYNSQDPKMNEIWWSVYHGDRFTSLLLGLPYGFNDTHLSLPLKVDEEESGILLKLFSRRTALVTGKLIDRNLHLGTSSIERTMELEDEMVDIAASMPKSWWEIPDCIPGPEIEHEPLTQRLLQHVYFLHIRIYLHLPFLLHPVSSSPTSLYEVSKSIGLNSSRQLLKTYIMLTTEFENQQSLFDCKTCDFAGFMAAVLLCIIKDNSQSRLSLNDLARNSDLALIESAKDIFQRLGKREGGDMASQYRHTLMQLLSSQNNSISDTPNSFESHKIRIPYFGTVVRQRKKRTAAEISTDGPGMVEKSTMTDKTEHFGLMNEVNMDESEGQVDGWEVDAFGGFEMDDLSMWLDTSLMDENIEEENPDLGDLGLLW
ncbi:hypothetical protein B7494_g3724 [Chlorociboria aeruginascens]|nr:hypothetical protein B7494_g3724 [Chlorociboria aeruginascens]